MADGLTQTNEIAIKSKGDMNRARQSWGQLERDRDRGREEIQSYLNKSKTDGQTDLQCYRN